MVFDELAVGAADVSAGVGAGAGMGAAGVDAERDVVAEAEAAAPSETSSIVTGRGPVDMVELVASLCSATRRARSLSFCFALAARSSWR